MPTGDLLTFVSLIWWITFGEIRICVQCCVCNCFSGSSCLQFSVRQVSELLFCLDAILRKLIDLMKENSFTLEKARSRWYPSQMIMDADYADDTVLLANTHALAKCLLHSLDRVHVLKSKWWYLYTKWYLFETSRQVHLPWKQHLIYRKRHKYATREGMDSYW